MRPATVRVAGLTMLFLTDTIDLDPARTADFVRLVHESAVPVMIDAGAALFACWSTRADLGESVTVFVAWSVYDFARWNEIRKNLVLDPRWHRYGIEAARLWRGGKRRFYEPAESARKP